MVGEGPRRKARAHTGIYFSQRTFHIITISSTVAKTKSQATQNLLSSQTHRDLLSFRIQVWRRYLCLRLGSIAAATIPRVL